MECLIEAPGLDVLGCKIPMSAGILGLDLKDFLIGVFRFLQLASLKVNQSNQFVVKGLLLVIGNTVDKLDSAVRVILADIKRTQTLKDFI